MAVIGWASTNLKIMHLVNFPKVKVKKYPQGYAVEIQLKKWWGKKYWRHIVSVSGMSDVPWYYQNEDVAVEEVSKHFKWDILFYSARS
jgi:hypothetical protein